MGIGGVHPRRTCNRNRRAAGDGSRVIRLVAVAESSSSRARTERNGLSEGGGAQGGFSDIAHGSAWPDVEWAGECADNRALSEATAIAWGRWTE